MNYDHLVSSAILLVPVSCPGLFRVMSDPLRPQLVDFSGSTQLVFIVGDPVHQVKAPAGLTPRLQMRGADMVVVPAHVTQDDFPDFIGTVSRTANVAGLIVTVPHKFAARSCCAEVDPVASRVGAVNLMRRTSDGRWFGGMTDGEACLLGVRRLGFVPAGKRCLLIGAGGAGIAVADSLAGAGVAFLGVQETDQGRASVLQHRVPSAVVLPAGPGPVDAGGYDLVVNATLVGTFQDDPSPCDCRTLTPSTFVADLACGPGGSTRLIDEAAGRGCPTMSGDEMFEAVADRLADFFVPISEGPVRSASAPQASDIDDVHALQLRRLLDGYQATQAIHAAAVLGVADVLSSAETDVATIARQVGADPDTLYRLLRALAALGVFREHDQRRFTLAPMGSWLRSDAIPSMRPWAMFVGEPMRWRAWGHLSESVRSGKEAFPLVHGVDSWTHRRRDAAAASLFQAAMTANSERIDRDIVAVCDLADSRHLLDVAGGRGSLLASFLAAHPDLSGTLFDLPETVAAAVPALRAEGVRDRCRIVGGDMFDGIPSGCDAILMKFILHDWDDDSALQILRGCHEAIEPDGRLIVVEYLVAHPNQGLHGKMSDLNMLLGPGGRERTLEEYTDLLGAAGFELTSVTHTTALVSLLVARARR